MPTSTPSSANSLPAPTFQFKEKARLGTDPGGLFYVLINDRKVCDYQHWAFHSCGVGNLSNFKNYLYDGVKREEWAPDYRAARQAVDTNFILLEKYHVALFEWLKTHSPDNWFPKEFYMVLSDSQLRMLPTLLAHPCVRKVDHFLNKSHGPSRLHMFRISLQQDFPT